MNSIKTNAEYYQRGLIMGLDLLAETMAWIDQTLVTEAVPDIALIEASLCGSQGPYAVADWLAQLPGEADKRMVARRLLYRMLPLIPEVVHWLYDMASDDDWPDLAGEGQMWSFWDEYDDAVSGVYGNLEEIRKELRAFLLRAALLVEVALFQEWAKVSFPDGGYGEWEWDYGAWDKLYPAVFEFMAAHPFSAWTQEEISAVLYALARDNEAELLAGDLPEDLLLQLTQAAIACGEQAVRWQLAVQLGERAVKSEKSERLLLALAHDENEYVRRRALSALTSLGSPAVEDLSLEMWERADPSQEYSRMMVLSCLQKIASPKLEALLAEAEKDTRPYLRAAAERIRQGK
jgi:hypothetical protein